MYICLLFHKHMCTTWSHHFIGNTFHCDNCLTTKTCRLSENLLLYKMEINLPDFLIIERRCQLFGIDSTTNRTYFMCTIGKTYQCTRRETEDRFYVECPMNSSLVDGATVDIRLFPKYPSSVHCPGQLILQMIYHVHIHAIVYLNHTPV